MDVNDKTLKAMATAMNYRMLKQEIISSNIANAETPGYKAKRVEFEDSLARALNVDGHLSMNGSDSRHFDVGSGGFANLEPDIVQDPNGVVSEDGNTVNIEDEMTEQTQNEIMYNALVQLVNKKLAIRKYLINSER